MAIPSEIFIPANLAASNAILAVMLGIMPFMFIMAGLFGTVLHHVSATERLLIRQRYLATLGGLGMVIGLLSVVMIGAQVSLVDLWVATFEYIDGNAGFTGRLMGFAALATLLAPIFAITALIRIYFVKKKIVYRRTRLVRG
jgi:hypothetical protein